MLPLRATPGGRSWCRNGVWEMKQCIGGAPASTALSRKVKSKTWVRLGSDKLRQRIPSNTNDGLSAPLSFTEF